MSHYILLLQESVPNTSTSKSHFYQLGDEAVVLTSTSTFPLQIPGENTADPAMPENIRSPLTGKFPRGYMKQRQEEIDPSYKKRAVAARKALVIEQSDFKPVTLATLRLQKGLTQQELATSIGTSQSHIAKIEANDLKVYFNTAIKISDALGITLDQLRECLDFEQENTVKLTISEL